MNAFQHATSLVCLLRCMCGTATAILESCIGCLFLLFSRLFNFRSRIGIPAVVVAAAPKGMGASGEAFEWRMPVDLFEWRMPVDVRTTASPRCPPRLSGFRSPRHHQVKLCQRCQLLDATKSPRSLTLHPAKSDPCKCTLHIDSCSPSFKHCNYNNLTRYRIHTCRNMRNSILTISIVQSHPID